MNNIRKRNYILSENIRIEEILFFSCLILLLSHGASTQIISSIAINFFTLFVIVLILFFNQVNLGRMFSFITTIYICGHFNFIPVYGGLFVLVASGIFFMTIFLKGSINLDFQGDNKIKILVWLFIFFNVLGWIFKNKMSGIWYLLNILTLIGYLYSFIISKNLFLTKNMFKILVKVFYVSSFYQLLVSLNAYLGILKIEMTPLIPTELIFNSDFAYGTMNSSELFGEYGLLMFFFFFILVVNKTTCTNFGLNRFLLFTGVFINLLNLWLSFSRSVIFLMLLGLLFYALTVFSKNKKQLVSIISIMFFIPLLLIPFWSALKLDYMFDRFTDQNLAKPIVLSNDTNILTGENTPRELAFSYFLMRYPQESWWIGYGLGIPKSNREAWFDNPNINRSDYHSLYLSMLMIYGWIGSLIFLLIILETIRRLWSISYGANRSYSEHWKIPAMCFLFMLIFMLFNQYKTSLMREPTYHLLFWIWLGIANSIYYAVIRYRMQNEKK